MRSNGNTFEGTRVKDSGRAEEACERVEAVDKRKCPAQSKTSIKRPIPTDAAQRPL